MSDDVGTVDVVSKTALFAGVLGLGVALGASIGLEATQSVCMISSETIPEGQQLFGGVDKSASQICWENAQTMKTVADASGYTAAALLLGGGIADRYDTRVRGLFGIDGAER